VGNKPIRSWRFGIGAASKAPNVNLLVGGEAPTPLTFSQVNGVWTSKVTLAAGTRKLEMRIARGDAWVTKNEFVTVETIDEHSLVRLQGEILATNRLRTISLAIAATPVRRAFFT